MEYKEAKFQKGETGHPTQFADHSPANPQATDFCSPLCHCLRLWSWFLLCMETNPKHDLSTQASLRQADVQGSSCEAVKTGVISWLYPS